MAKDTYFLDWKILKLRQENSVLELSLSPEELKKLNSSKKKKNAQK